MDAVRCNMRYVKSTVDYGLFYVRDKPLTLIGYTDADWAAGCPIDRRSTSGYAFGFGSGMISWSSKKQPTVALSSTEAEYRGAALAACEIAWLLKLMADLDIQVDAPVKLLCDNLSSVLLAMNPVYHARTKHIEVHYHFIREMVLAGKVDLMHVRTDEQVAVIFTKSLGKDKFCGFRQLLGVQMLS